MKTYRYEIMFVFWVREQLDHYELITCDIVMKRHLCPCWLPFERAGGQCPRSPASLHICARLVRLGTN